MILNRKFNNNKSSPRSFYLQNNKSEKNKTKQPNWEANLCEALCCLSIRSVISSGGSNVYRWPHGPGWWSSQLKAADPYEVAGFKEVAETIKRLRVEPFQMSNQIHFYCAWHHQGLLKPGNKGACLGWSTSKTVRIVANVSVKAVRKHSVSVSSLSLTSLLGRLIVDLTHQSTVLHQVVLVPCGQLPLTHDAREAV